MANWWDQAPVVGEQQNWWDDAPLASEMPPEELANPATVDSGMLLPISKDAEGNISFDSDAGLLGSLKRTFMLPGQVMAGEVDPLSEEGIGRSLEFATTVNPINPAIRAGDRAIPGVLKAPTRAVKVPLPSADDLYEEASRNFRAMRESGVDYASEAVKNMSQAMKMRLEEQGFDAEVAGKTHRILDKLASPPEGSVASIKGLHSARKTFGKIAQNFNDPTDQSAASEAIRGLDEFIGAADPSSVVAGTAADASRYLRQGNSNYSAAKRSDLLTGIERSADLRAAAANSGANTGNAIRQRVASALDQPRKVSGYSPDEIRALEAVVKGTAAENATRRVGNLLGGGGGLGQLLTAAIGGAGGSALMGGPQGAAIGAAIPAGLGMLAKGLSNSMTRKGLGKADEMVRMRSALSEYLQGMAGKEVVGNPRRDAIIKALMMSYQQPSGGGW